jgi:hypothetical protein
VFRLHGFDVRATSWLAPRATASWQLWSVPMTCSMNNIRLGAIQKLFFETLP